MTRGRAAGIGLAAVALAASAYLTIAHYTSPRVLACSASGRVNCEAVTTSAWSEVAGIPVALLGLLWSVGMLVLFLPIGDRAPIGPRLRRLGTLAGVLMVLWLVYVEFALVGAVCLWCTVVHVAAVGLFAITSAGLDGPSDDQSA